MFSIRVQLRGPICWLRSSRVCRTSHQQVRSLTQTFRGTAKVTKPSYPASPAKPTGPRFCKWNYSSDSIHHPNLSNCVLVYPERLIVYHAGTGRTVFLGCLKLTTIFIFTFFSLVVAPAHFNSDDEPKWVAGGGTFAIQKIFQHWILKLDQIT